MQGAVRVLPAIRPVVWARAVRFRRTTLVHTYKHSRRNRELQELPPSSSPPPKLDKDGNVHWDAATILSEYELSRDRRLMDHGRSRQTMSLLMSQVRSTDDAALGACLRVFEDIKQRFTPVAEDYTVVMQAYGRAGQLDRALDTYRAMQAAGVAPVANTYGALVRGCALAGDEAQARGHFDDMVQRGLCGDHVRFDKVYDALRRL